MNLDSPYVVLGTGRICVTVRMRQIILGDGMEQRPKRLWILLLMLVSILGVSTNALGQDEQPNDALICHDEPIKLDRYRYLRAVSLDVLGQPPSVSQIEDLSNVSDTEPLPDALLNGLLSDPKFTEQVVRRHRAYLWPNLSNIEVLRREQRLTASRGIWWNSIRSQRYRTGTRDRLRCADRPATFGANGEIIHTLDENGFKLEGWVEVEPYWAPGEVFESVPTMHKLDGMRQMARTAWEIMVTAIQNVVADPT